MILLLVESPTKARTLKTFLGKNYEVKASFGHVRDLPKRELGVDIENNFEPKYIVPPKSKKTISELRKENEKADKTILATDEDREGEAIAWHLQEALKLKDPQRIVFHEITENAIKKALENPRDIDMNMVNAQQARRILDRIVGYKLSPFLWKKVAKGLSAGRVQSVAVRLIVEREREIEKFVQAEYWSIETLLKKNEKEFIAKLVKINGLETRAPIRQLADGARPSTKIENFSALVKNKKEADKILQDLEGAKYVVESVEKKEAKRHPAPAFTTSTLTQTAANRFGFPAKITMSLAQKLYEQGLITYHRTDSLNLSAMSLVSAKKFITESLGQKYWAGTKYRTKDNSAQEAHEAIRPAYADKTPQSLTGIDSRQLKLYTLIWQRFIACQMAPARFDSTIIEIKAQNPKSQIPNYTFRASGQILKFDGFLKVYPTKFEEADLPELEKNEKLELVKLDSLQHFTEPPARYSEASLIKTLEKFGIGRPSTYAPTLATIQERNYVEKNRQKRFAPTEMGNIVNDVLVKNFPEIVDIDFTAKMEKELDEIADGKDTWQKTCRDFYNPFSKNLAEKYKDVKKENLVAKTDKICPKCGSPMVERLGRFGRFYACSKFPECKHTESIENGSNNLGIKCPKCREGDIVARKTRPKRGYPGKIFYGCNRFPKCDFALWDKPVNDFCPKCNSILAERGKKSKCSNKECDYEQHTKSN